MSTFNLYDLSKKGTLVLAGPRYGSHFLAQVVIDWLPAEFKPEQGVGGHSEIGITDQRLFGVSDEIATLVQQPGYQVAIVNDQSAKLWIMSQPDLVKDWHIVRIIHNDKLHWFKSYWYFLMNSDSRFEHHGTSQTVYEEHLGQHGQYTITPNQIMNIGWTLSQTLINQHIACNEQIDYSELSKLETNVQWRENKYPDTSLSELFSNSDALEKLLTNWPKEL